MFPRTPPIVWDKDIHSSVPVLIVLDLSASQFVEELLAHL